MTLRKTIEAGIESKRLLLEHCEAEIADAARMVTRALVRGGRVFLCGNGGSAADAQHIAAEFTGRFEVERGSLAAIALTTDTSAITAIANDYGFEQVFSRQLSGLGKQGDVLIGISTSGDSKNVVAAFETANEMGIDTIVLTGSKQGKLSPMSDVAIEVPSERTARIQESHILVGHHICSVVDSLFQKHHVAVETLRMIQDKVVSLEQFMEIRSLWKDASISIAWTNGCFDLVHAGHIASFEAAKEEADILVVGVNSDASIQSIKGPERPIVPELHRANLIAAFDMVDYVIIFDESTPAESLQRIQPEVHCKGVDYLPPDGKPIPEKELVEAYGGRIVFTSFIDGLSTSKIISRIMSAYRSS